MIGEPLNDRRCLGQISQRAADARRSPEVLQLARGLADTSELVAHIRRLPQRDDSGEGQEPPTIACDVPQRVRLLPRDPNCVERSLAYLAVAEAIDPVPLRQLAMVEFPDGGRHVYPVENDLEVVLDPTVPRNALAAGLFRLRNALGQEPPMSQWSPQYTLEWIARVAAAEASNASERASVVRGRAAFRALLDGQRVTADDVKSIGVTMALADRAAPLWGPNAGRVVYVAVRALQALAAQAAPAARNLSFRIGRYVIKPDWDAIRRLGETAGPLAVQAAAVAYGVPPPVAAAAGQAVADSFSVRKSDKNPVGKVTVRKPDKKVTVRTPDGFVCVREPDRKVT